MEYIKKVAEKELWNSGKVELWDLSRCNTNEESRVECISQIASVCYGKPPKDAKKLVERLWTESGGLPSSALEFIRLVNPDGSHSGIADSLRNWTKMPTLESITWPIESDLRIHRANIATFRLTVPIFLARQIVRHRQFSHQELCISGESKISTSKGLRRIKDLYAQQNKPGTDGRVPAIRIYNLATQRFELEKRYKVVKSGKKKLLELKVQVSNGKRRVIRATAEHKFLTKEGWKELSGLHPGDFIAVNGQPIWRDREFLKKAKADFLARGIGMKGMAEELGINYNTLKKWIYKFGLQYTPKEVASTYTVWNKGIRGKNSHLYGRKLSVESREKIARKLTQDVTKTSRGFRARVANYWLADFRRQRILARYGHRCAMCGATENLEIDHIKPVSLYPELAFDEDNVQILCHECHRLKSNLDQSLARLTARYVMIESITEAGMEETFDIQVENPNHNYVANGFIVHNSRRYTTDKQVPFRFWTSEELMAYRPGVSYEGVVDMATELYEILIKDGVRPEVARAVLPQSLYTTLWMQGDVPAWKNYFRLRLDGHTQKEHRDLAQAMLNLLEEHQQELWNRVRPKNDQR